MNMKTFIYTITNYGNVIFLVDFLRFSKRKKQIEILITKVQHFFQRTMLNSGTGSSSAKSKAGSKDDQKVDVDRNKRKEEDKQQLMSLLGVDQAKKAGDAKMENGSGASSQRVPRPPHINQNAGKARTHIQKDHNIGGSSSAATTGNGSKRGTGEQKHTYNHTGNAASNRDPQHWRNKMSDNSNQRVYNKINQSSFI